MITNGAVIADIANTDGTIMIITTGARQMGRVGLMDGTTATVITVSVRYAGKTV